MVLMIIIIKKNIDYIIKTNLLHTLIMQIYFKVDIQCCSKYITRFTMLLSLVYHSVIYYGCYNNNNFFF